MGIRSDKTDSKEENMCPSQELKGQLNCWELGLGAKRLKGHVCRNSCGHSLSEYLLWNSDLNVNVVVTIAIAINTGDAFPSQANLLVCLNPSRDLLRKICASVPWSIIQK